MSLIARKMNLQAGGNSQSVCLCKEHNDISIFYKGEIFMKKSGLLISMVFIVLSFLLYGSHVLAVEKTGFINLEEILSKSEPGKKADAEFVKIFEKDKFKIQEKETELKKLKDDLEKQRTVLTEAAMKEKETAYQKKFRDYQLVVKDANEELQAKRQGILKELMPEIMKVVNAIGDREKYLLIIDISTVPVAYYAKENDLTKRVVEEFNKIYKPKN
jgi:outer membrane protein